MSGGALDLGALLPIDSEAVHQVTDGSIKGCPVATSKEMADGFLSNPSWSDFTSLSGEEVVELNGGMSYDGMPTQLVMQFPIDAPSGSIAVRYAEIGGVGQHGGAYGPRPLRLRNGGCDAVRE